MSKLDISVTKQEFTKKGKVQNNPPTYLPLTHPCTGLCTILCLFDCLCSWRKTVGMWRHDPRFPQSWEGVGSTSISGHVRQQSFIPFNLLNNCKISFLKMIFELGIRMKKVFLDYTRKRMFWVGTLMIILSFFDYLLCARHSADYNSHNNPAR